MTCCTFKLGLLLSLSLSLTSACDPNPESVVGDAPSTDSSSSGSDSSSTSTSTSTSGGDPVDGEAYCSQFTSIDDCLGAITPDVTCGWSELVSYDSDCGILGERAACLWVPSPGTADGCAPPLTCPGDVFFRKVEGGLEVIGQCGGSFVDGFEPCPASGAGDDEPYAFAECNCACGPAGGSSGTD